MITVIANFPQTHEQLVQPGFTSRADATEYIERRVVQRLGINDFVMVDSNGQVYLFNKAGKILTMTATI